MEKNHDVAETIFGNDGYIYAIKRILFYWLKTYLFKYLGSYVVAKDIYNNTDFCALSTVNKHKIRFHCTYDPKYNDDPEDFDDTDDVKMTEYNNNNINASLA